MAVGTFEKPAPVQASAAEGGYYEIGRAVRRDLLAIARNPVPSGAAASVLTAEDGLELRYAVWQPSRGPRRGTVCLFTGRGEFIEKYFEVVADIRRRGFTVTVLDWRGQGGSGRELRDPAKGHVRDFSWYDRDLARFMKEVVLPDCPPPYVALAHSMGGNIMLRNARLTGSWFEKMVLVAPMIRFNDERLPVRPGLARWGSELGTLTGFGRSFAPGEGRVPWEMRAFEGNPLTSDPERFARNRAVLEADPGLGLGGPTFAWIRAAYRSMDMIATPAYPVEVKVPLLIFAAGADAVVSTRIIEEFSQRLKTGSYVFIANSRHEILQERDELRKQFWATFDAYVGVEKVA